eukprot:m.281586 g.281586  ORF g.281586 m.281586 type:complete len:58 (+) comp154142_c0_seq1:3-176(+)
MSGCSKTHDQEAEKQVESGRPKRKWGERPQDSDNETDTRTNKEVENEGGKERKKSEY